MPQISTLVAVIGAGPAGLAASHALARRKIDHVVLEKGEAVGHSWSNVYESLRLHTGKHMSALPGMSFPRSTPLFVRRQTLLDYLQAYTRRFRIPVETRCAVTDVQRLDDGWQTSTAMGDLRARHLIVATGIMSEPRWPEFEGREEYRGRVIHSAEYRRPEPYIGKQVLVVGVGQLRRRNRHRAGTGRGARRHLDTDRSQLRTVDFTGDTHTVLFAVVAVLAETRSGGYGVRRVYRRRAPSEQAGDPETWLRPVRETACDRIRSSQRRSRRFDIDQDGHSALH